MLGTMYHPMPVSHDQSCSPDAGSRPSTFFGMATTSSVFPPPTSTSSGVFHACLMPGARHTSLPLLLSSATMEVLSTLALTITRLPWTIGDAAEPHPLSFEPTSACQS